jgi:DNA-binding beta-propeller fold protein YncE
MVRGARRRVTARRTGLASAALLSLGALTAACSSGSTAPERPTVLVAAPEPARAPEPAIAPSGSVMDLGGGRPEGAVGDPVTGLVAISVRDPNRVLVIDTARDRIVRTVAVPGSARHLQLAPGGGAVLVPGEDTDKVSTLSLTTFQVGTVVPVLRQPHDVAPTDGGDLYVADEFGAAVSLVRGGTVTRTFPGLVQPGGAAGTGNTGTVVDVRARLLHVYRGGEEVAALPAGAGPTHAVATTPGEIWVTDTTGDALLRYDVRGTPRQTATVPLAGRPYGTAYDAERGLLYITATATNTLVQYRVTPEGLQQLRTWPTVRDAYSVAVAPRTGRVLVAGESGSQLQLIDP